MAALQSGASFPNTIAGSKLAVAPAIERYHMKNTQVDFILDIHHSQNSLTNSFGQHYIMFTYTSIWKYSNANKIQIYLTR